VIQSTGPVIVFILSKVRGETGVYHSAYLRRLLAHLGEACRDCSPNLRILYTQIRFFEDNNLNADVQDWVLLEPMPNADSYHLRCAQLDLEWQLK
jgi:hypothetical protein